MIVRKYDYRVEKVFYEHGYRYESRKLPDWMYLTITEDPEKENKFLTVHSRIHVNTEVKLYPVYSNEFSDYAIIKDLSGEICRRFL